jgi:hypothetical protein
MILCVIQNKILTKRYPQIPHPTHGLLTKNYLKIKHIKSLKRIKVF